MLCRDAENVLLPDPATELASGDRLLVAAGTGVGHRLGRLVDNENTLSRAVTGQDIHPGWLWQRLFSKADLTKSP